MTRRYLICMKGLLEHLGYPVLEPGGEEGINFWLVNANLEPHFWI